MKLILQKIMLILIAFTAISQLGNSQCTVDAGTISTTDPTTICVDGIPDPINVTIAGAIGTESAWIITDTGNNILGTPPGGPFDLDGAGPGTCLIWYISHDGTLAGNIVGNNISDLTGCFDLSNEITVTRNEPLGGTITTNDPTTICVDGIGDPIDVTLTGETGTNSGWVITDTGNNILGLPAGPPFDLDGAGPGTCLIWHLSYEDGLMGMTVGMNTADFDGCYELSNEITVTRNEPLGGTITTNDPTTICVDGIGDPIDVTLTGEAGTNSGWVITDTGNNILGLPAGPPFDLDGAGPGTCLIWHLSYEDGLTGMTVGMNTADFDGCYELSNEITVTRNEPLGGTITTNDPTTICVDGIGDPIDVTLIGEAGTNSGWVITDTGNNILGLPAGPPFDLDGAGPGTCLIWHLSYEDGLTGMTVGMNTADFDGCYELSNEITVVRNEPLGGTITTTDPTTICVDGIGDPIDVTLTGEAGTNSGWVITDVDNIILGLPAGPPFDLDGAGPGTCLIWHLSYEDGLTGMTVGLNTADMDGCYELSNNITVVRNEPDGGTLSTDDETTICVDGTPDPIEVIVEDAVGTNSQWIITNDTFLILGKPAGPIFDLDGAGAGTCLIWYMRYEDTVMGDTLGGVLDSISGCFDLSDSIVVVRNEAIGGEISTTDETTICVDGIGDPIDVTLTGEAGTNSGWVITDPNNNILGLPSGPPFDLDGAGPGTCLIWHLSYEDGLTGMTVGMNTADFDGCYELSNSIAVTRNEPIGGTISTTDETTICVDGIGDPIDVTLTGEAGTNSGWVITDTGNNILGLPPGPPFDLDGAGPGTCLIWHLSYEDGLTGMTVGMNTADFDGCYEFSNNITVIRNEEIGGTISTTDETTICIDGIGDPIDVTLTGNSGSNSGWVITDTGNNILGLPPGPPFDLDGAGPGTCLIWHLSYSDGLTGMEVGMNTDNMDGCFELSNSITVVRNEAIGGTISTSDPTTICVDGIGDPINVTLTGEAGPNSGWVITDTDLNILGTPPGPPFDLDGAGPGVCLIWHISFADGLQGAEVGMNAADLEGCYELSNSIAVIRDAVDAGQISLANGETLYAGCPGDIVIDVQNNSENIYFDYYYVITNQHDVILEWVDASTTSTLDLSAAPAGECHVWGWNSIGTTTPMMGDHISSLEGEDCEELTNNHIIVLRTLPDGGYISLDDGATEYEGCAGEIDFDLTFETSTFQNYWFVVTDDNSNILTWFNSDNGGWIDINGAPPGVCRIYGWNEMNQSEPTPGAHISSLNDLMCGDVSENWVTITRLDCEAEECGVSPATINTAAAKTQNRVVVANRGSGTVSVIDADSDEVITTYDMPNEGEPMYVVYNNSNNTYLVGDYYGYVAAFNANDFSLTGIAEAGNGVFHMWLTPDNSQLWVNNELDRTISVINPTTLENIATVELPEDLYDLGYKPHDVILMPNNEAAFVTLLGSEEEDYVIKYSTSTFEETGRVAVGLDPHVILTPSNDKLYVAAQGANSLYVLNRSDLSLVTQIEVPNAHGLGINASGTHVYIGNISEGGSNATYTLDLSTNELVGDPVDAPFAVPHNYATIGDEKLYLTHSGGANFHVSVYDLTPTPVLNKTIDVQSNPFGLAAFSINNTTDVTICVDGVGDPIDVTVEGGEGMNSAWVITDVDGNILALPPMGPFDLDGAGEGVCLIWYLTYDNVEGAEVGLNANDLEGCFALSNPITVTRESADGGTVALASGGTEETFCAGDVVFDVTHSTAASNLSYWYIITDENDNILAAHNTADGPTLDLSGAPAGECHVWGWSSNGEMMPVMGENISSLSDGACESISSNYIRITRITPTAAVISTMDETTICVDGEGDPIDVDVEGGTGSNSAWVITDTDGNILGLPPMGPFDLDGAGEGVCLIWYLTYEDVSGVEVGLNANDLDGCFALSNSITVTRESANGGTVELAEGGTVANYCAGEVVFDVTHETTAQNLSYWYIITDADDNILASHNTADGPTLDLSGAPAGECHVWGWSYSGEDLPVMGENISTLADGTCEAISENFITVNRETPDGGTVLLEDGTETGTFEAGDVVFDVQHSTTAPNLSYWYIITDNNDNILAFHNSADGPTLDLSGAPAGECHIWGWNYKGLDDPIIGENISTLADDFCEAISDNFITIIRNEPTGSIAATISTLDDTTICVDGEGDPINVTVDGGQGANSAYVITDVDGNILGLPPMGPFDLDGAGEGICLIWHLNYEMIEGLEMGMNTGDLTGDFAFSNAITVTRQAANGGTISLIDGSVEATFIAGSVVFDVQHETTATALSYWYIITDDNDNILAYHNSADGPTLDLSGAPVGECHIWGWSYKGEPNPVMGENISTLEDGTCEAISDNFIRIIRTEGLAAATISTDDETTICVDGIGDPINIIIEGGQGANSAYVITDTDGNILGLPPMGPFDLDGAGEGICLIWHLNYETVEGLEMGMNTADLTGEFAFSNEITVTRQAANGGTVALTNGQDTATYCVGNIIFDVQHETTATALGYWYIITDNNDNILAFHNTEDGPTLDLSAAPAGECHVWGWSSNGATVPVMGESINSLNVACGAVSSNFITIYRAEGIIGGTINSQSNLVTCPNDGEDDIVNITTTGEGDVYVYVLTDQDDMVLGAPTLSPSYNFEEMESGVVRIYGLAYKGDIEIGNSITDIGGTCNSLSVNFIEVTVLESEVCSITSTEDLDENSVKIYPNPANNYININYSDLALNASLSMYDAQGKLVLKKDLTEISGIAKVDVNNLQGGMYFVQIISEENSITKRILITK